MKPQVAQTRVLKLRAGMRYLANLVAMVARQRGYVAAGAAGSRFVIAEVAKLPKFALLASAGGRRVQTHPTMYSNEIVDALATLGVEMRAYRIDVDAFRRHVVACNYPRNYGAGPLDEGGVREQKLLEYFVSLDLLSVRPSDLVIDVASEWSIFPDVLRELSAATVYRQDLIYPPGINGNRVGGSAARMPVAGEFADKLVLHNAFEHFERSADFDFIAEAWRVLKPGGTLCILPLFVSDEYTILTDPLVDRRGIVWDEGARVVEVPGWHNRFGRFYDASALRRRVLIPASGFSTTIYHFVNVKDVHPRAHLHFALVMRKPAE
jgi:SAM-dependent methyltransferase